MDSAKSPQIKKAKKKQVKDEVDRIKQAEKKKRRLEKALATSAAIRLELEKKKQQKKQEQERLDEEGAAIAEAVALHVLLEEDSDDPSIAFKDKLNLDDWHNAPNISLFTDRSVLSRQNLKRCSVGNVDWFPGACGKNGFELTHHEEHDSSFKGNIHLPCFDDGTWTHDDISFGLIAAQAVGSLRIEDVRVDIPVFFDKC